MPRPKPFRLVLLSLVVGAIVTTCIAFACARWAPRERRAISVESLNREPLPEGVTFKPFPRGIRMDAMIEDGPGFEYMAILSINRRMQTQLQYGHGYRCEAGWPFHAWVMVIDDPPYIHRMTRPDYRAQVWGTGSQFAVPRGPITILRPLWPGFIANTLLFSAAILVPSLGLPFLHSRYRIKRHRCPSCGYARTPADCCPECGAPYT